MWIECCKLFIMMLLEHLLYDFHWQGPFIAENKGRYPFLLFIHALTWATLLSVTCWLLGHGPIVLFGWLLITHYFTDKWKSRLPKTPEWFWAIYVDQGIHFATIVIAVPIALFLP